MTINEWNRFLDSSRKEQFVENRDLEESQEERADRIYKEAARIISVEQGKPPKTNKGLIPEIAVKPNDEVAAVLREHVVFLREQLEHKRHWYEMALDEQKERIQKTFKDSVAWFGHWQKARTENRKLRMWLAQCVERLFVHNNDSKNEVVPSEVNPNWLRTVQEFLEKDE